MSALYVFTVAVASVEVENGGDCLDSEDIDFELRAALSGDLVDSLVTRVNLLRGERWAVQLSVLERETVLWSRELAVDPADCPYLAQVIARSVERGIATLPDWQFPSAPERPPSDVGFQVFAAVVPDGAPRFGLGGALWLQLGQIMAWQLVADVQFGAPEAVAAAEVRSWGAVATTGPALHLALGRHALRGAARIGIGPNFYRTAGLNVQNRSGWWWRSVAQADLGWASPGALKLFARGELALDPVQYEIVDLTTGDSSYSPEPIGRVGLVMEISAPVRIR